MSEQFFDTNAQSAKRRVGDASSYSALIQEAMRYDKLPSASYSLVMSLLNAVAQGYGEEQWREEGQRVVQTLSNQLADPKAAHADLANRYEQTVRTLKDLALWPW